MLALVTAVAPTPTMWQSFRLRPHNFFDRNPAIDLRAEPAATR